MKNVYNVFFFLRILFFIAIVLIIEHTTIFLWGLYKLSGPRIVESCESFDSFVFLVSPKTNIEIENLPAEQMYLAEILKNELVGQSQNDVLNNNKGSIRIIGKYVNDRFSRGFEDLIIKTDISFFDIVSIDELKEKLCEYAYVDGTDIFPELNGILPNVYFPVSPITIYLDGGDLSAYLYYNDRYIRFCSYEFGNDFQYDYDYIYTVDKYHNIKVVRNTCQQYKFD